MRVKTDPVEISVRSYDGLLRGENLFEQYLASKGFVVLAVNYRGGSGFGREFQDLGVKDWANGQARDAAARIDMYRSAEEFFGRMLRGEG